MGIYFGTDGIRGIVGDNLTYNLAFKCGNVLARQLHNPTIIIGADTRKSASYITTAFAGGAMSAGGNIIDIGVCPTAGIAYVTKTLKANFGVVVSASHNPPEYNGIKIFDDNGVKLGDKREDFLEKDFVREVYVNNLGRYKQDFSLTKLYEDYLISTCDCCLKNLKIVLDGSNGAAYKIAPNVFKKLGAKVISINCKNDGDNINNNCGSTFPENLSKAVKRYRADMGFAFDGDADRIIACDENGNILDGDIIIYILSKYLKWQDKLKDNTVVGTKHTNMGIEKCLENDGIKLVRTDIGDKYVIAKMEEDNLSLGGEKSGHIIFRELSTTGDGILSGIKIAELVKKSGKKLSTLCDVELFPQINIDVVVVNKEYVIHHKTLQNEIMKQSKYLGKDSRIMVRASGTESKIRIMCEGENEDKCLLSARELENVVNKIDGDNVCVE